MTLQPGSLLNKRYKILEVIAHGGMGGIYRAMDESLGVEVAVKENFFSSDDHSRQFHREATILASLRHAHLPRVTDHFVLENQQQYLVMDFIPGDDLRKRVANTGRLEEAEALNIGISISEAVSYLHHREPPVLHRDIKPGNVKVTPGGQIYLVDFGLAKIAQAGQQTTIGAQSLTPGYAPPEQYGQGTDQRSDIYALAATLYNILTGHVPEDALTRAMGAATLTPLREHSPNVSEETAAAVEKGMAVDPESRFQTIDAFRLALENARDRSQPRLQSAPSQSQTVIGTPAQVSNIAPVVVSAQPASRPRKGGSRWWAVSLTVLLLLGGVSGIGYLATRLLSSARPAQPTQTPTAVSATQTSAPTQTAEPAAIQTPAPSATVIPPATEAAATTAPATQAPAAATPVGGGQGQLAFASDRSGKMQVWVMDVDGSNARQVTQMQDGACQPDWSADGLRLVFVSPCKAKQDQYQGSSLFIINADGSSLVSLATTPGGDFDPAWSPDGTSIAFTSLRDGRPHIFLYSFSDDKFQRLSPAPVYDRHPAWSPDGTQIAFTTSRQGQLQVWTMNADGSNAQEFSLLDRGLASMPAWLRDGQVIVFSQGSPQPLLIAKRIGDRMNEFPVGEGVRPVFDAKVSSDGQWLVFEGKADGKRGIFRMTPNGTNFARITDGVAADIQPVWRP